MIQMKYFKLISQAFFIDTNFFLMISFEKSKLCPVLICEKSLELKKPCQLVLGWENLPRSKQDREEKPTTSITILQLLELL